MNAHVLRRSLLIALVGAFVCAPSVLLAKPDRTKLPGPTGATVWAPPPIQSWTMANGINVWFLQAKQAPLITLQLVTAQGSATDEPAKAGTADFMVDMLDEGAGKRDALALSDAFQLIATDYRGDAGLDGITFSLNMLADQLDASLGLLADVVRRPSFPEKEFERRKAQRLASALTSEANIGYGASTVGKRVLFGNGYGAFSSSGVRSTLEAITLEDLKKSYAGLVKPKGATIVVVGDVGTEQIKSALKKAFGDWSGAPTMSASAVKAASKLGGIYVVDFPGSAQSFVMMSRPVAGTEAPDYFDCLVFNRPFAGSFTGRVNMNLREDKGYTYGARGRFSRYKKAGTYVIYAKVKRDTTRASIDEMLKELKGVRGDKPLTQKELDEATGGLVKSFPGRFERMNSVAGQLARLVLDGYPKDWYSKWSGRVKGITLDVANKAAQAYADSESFAIIVAGDLSKIGASLKGLNRPIYRYDAQGKFLGKGLPSPKKK